MELDITITMVSFENPLTEHRAYYLHARAVFNRHVPYLSYTS